MNERDDYMEVEVMIDGDKVKGISGSVATVWNEAINYVYVLTGCGVIGQSVSFKIIAQ
uniref:Uncharacterized protein n=1 Tax=viral metagenome TaxID=1070528 RepID=A0A6H1ZI26_9ZZZZ